MVSARPAITKDYNHRHLEDNYPKQSHRGHSPEFIQIVFETVYIQAPVGDNGDGIIIISNNSDQQELFLRNKQHYGQLIFLLENNPKDGKRDILLDNIWDISAKSLVIKALQDF